MDKDTYLKMNKLKDKIESLNKENHIEIMLIFEKYSIVYSENKNGIFINMNDMSPIVLNEVDKYIQYLETQKNTIDDFEQKKHEIEMLL